jgi:hypothetical protein
MASDNEQNNKPETQGEYINLKVVDGVSRPSPTMGSIDRSIQYGEYILQLPLLNHTHLLYTSPCHATSRQNNNEVFFKIKRATQLRKLMDAYCQRQGKDEKTVRFLYDGVRLKPDSTPEEMEMEDGDSIDVMVAQIGGASL